MTDQEKKAIVLEKAGVHQKIIDDFMKSNSLYLSMYQSGTENEFYQPQITEGLRKLAEVRETQGLMIAGVELGKEDGKIKMIILFYADDKPENAFYEQKYFASKQDLVKELQIETKQPANEKT